MIFGKSYFNILKLIYDNPKIRLNELIKKSRISVYTAKDRINNLLNSNFIIEEKIIGGKKTLIKNFYPNLLSEEGQYVFSLIELEKKNLFFKRFPKLIGPFKQLITNLESRTKTIIIFGSFANFSQTKESDLDILFLINKKIDINNLKKNIERSFITFDHEISPRIDFLNNFKKNKNKGIYQTIIKNHIIIKGALDYIKLIS